MDATKEGMDDAPKESRLRSLWSSLLAECKSICTPPRYEVRTLETIVSNTLSPPRLRARTCD